jgi:UDP-N-acetylmuramate--alanine ligase
LGAITSTVPTIGAAGTHGKTTTTALLITALHALGRDPSFILGGDISSLGTNGYHGSEDLLVIEADEAFRTFEHLSLRGLIVTNVEPEHLEHFGSEEEMRRSFVSVAAAVDGPVVACGDDAGSFELAGQIGAPTYGTSDGSRWRTTDFNPTGEGSSFVVQGPDVSVEVHLSRPGLHVARNATGVLALIGEMGMDVSLAAEGLASFAGVGRRWEHRGVINDVALIDDYAHHPTEVGVNLTAAQESHQGRVWAVFQPHLYSRTERFSDEFGAALAKADVSVVTDVFAAREEPVPGITGELVAEAARTAGGVTHYVPHRTDLAAFLAPQLESGDLVISMGAGDITLLHNELAPLLAARR